MKEKPAGCNKPWSEHGILRISKAEILPGRGGWKTMQMKIAIEEGASSQKLLFWAKSGRSNRWKFARRAVTEKKFAREVWIFAGVRILLQTCWSPSFRREARPRTSPPVAVTPANGNRQTAKGKFNGDGGAKQSTVVPQI